MTGRENFTRAIEFSGPAYLPGTLWVNLDWLHEKDERQQQRIKELQAQFPPGLLGLWEAQARQREWTENDAKHWLDEFGTGWEDDGHGAKTCSHPLRDDYRDLPFPDPNAPAILEAADQRLAERGDRYVLGHVWFTLFERLWMLRGFENMLLDPYDNPVAFAALRDRLVEFNLAKIDQWLKRGVHGIFFSDDWGSQRGLLMNPDDWRRFYLPSYKRMFDRVHSGGAHVWMHLCGDITAILPDLIDIGLNVLNPVQPQAMDVRQLAREFGGKVCFNGGVDVQGTLIHGTPADVQCELHTLVDLFGRFHGGYIAGTSHTIMPETPLDNVIALFAAYLEFVHGSK
jgi:uroporphyrinogen decarboxylase